MRSSADTIATGTSVVPQRHEAARALASDAVMLALACALGLVESWVPSPLPGVRLGLANAATLVVLLKWGWRPALRVTFARVLLVGMLAGTLGGPAFLLSAAGAAASVAAMACAARARGLSPMGISAMGAFAHVAAQLTAAAFVVSTGAVVTLATPALLSCLPLGLATGAVAGALISRTEGSSCPSR
ncbi:MAG: Gx transporter family protein [Coriobacteriia bacterium]|nr:Gx transporter family protein [Coriobacteriia bacterium]